MKGGLGQLVDGLYGDDDYQKQLQGENSGEQFVVWTGYMSSAKAQGYKFAFTANKNRVAAL